MFGTKNPKVSQKKKVLLFHEIFRVFAIFDMIFWHGRYVKISLVKKEDSNYSMPIFNGRTKRSNKMMNTIANTQNGAISVQDADRIMFILFGGHAYLQDEHTLVLDVDGHKIMPNPNILDDRITFVKMILDRFYRDW